MKECFTNLMETARARCASSASMRLRSLRPAPPVRHRDIGLPGMNGVEQSQFKGEWT
jgi:hypothetical protein